jgi:hypothetical protein
VAPLAHPDQRAGVLSVLYTVSYLGMGVPAAIATLNLTRLRTPRPTDSKEFSR